MFKKGLTLRRADDFFVVYRRGYKWSGQGVLIYYLKKSKTNRRRLAVVISKKVDAKATARNLCRRRIWAAIRKINLPLFGYDLVVVVKQGFVKGSENFFKQDFLKWQQVFKIF